MAFARVILAFGAEWTGWTTWTWVVSMCGQNGHPHVHTSPCSPRKSTTGGTGVTSGTSDDSGLQSRKSLQSCSSPPSQKAPQAARGWFSTQRSRAAEKQSRAGLGASRDLGKRVAARSFARPRPRLSDALHRRHPTWKPASRDRKVPRKRLEVSLSSKPQTHLGTSKNFLSRRNGGLPNPARRGKPRKVLGLGPGGGGELVHRATGGA